MTVEFGGATITATNEDNVPTGVENATATVRKSHVALFVPLRSIPRCTFSPTTFSPCDNIAPLFQTGAQRSGFEMCVLPGKAPNEKHVSDPGSDNKKVLTPFLL